MDPTTRLKSIAGAVKVVTRKKFAELACAVNPGKRSDRQDLVAVAVDDTTSVTDEGSGHYTKIAMLPDAITHASH